MNFYELLDAYFCFLFPVFESLLYRLSLRIFLGFQEFCFLLGSVSVFYSVFVERLWGLF